MLDKQDRRLIMDALGKTIDGLVRDLYSIRVDGRSMAQEPEITSRICQRVEDQLNGRHVGDYIFHVIAQSMPDHGPRAVEKITGADLLLSISLDGLDGFDKGIFVQAKYDRNVNRDELIEACRRMERYVGSKGAYVWIYEAGGVKVVSPYQIRQMKGNTFEGLQRRSVAGLTGRILDCHAGSRAWGIPPVPNRRHVLYQRLGQVQARNALDLNLKRRR